MKTEILIVLAVLATIGTAAFFLRASRAAAGKEQPATTEFVFVKIPESMMPLDRSEKYGDPLDSALKREKLGNVTGGGSQLSEPDAQGKSSVEWVGLDVELVDLDRGLPFLKRELRRLGAPAGTTLEFARAGIRATESIAE